MKQILPATMFMAPLSKTATFYCCKVQVFLVWMFDGFAYFGDYTFVHNFGSFLCCRTFKILCTTADSLNL